MTTLNTRLAVCHLDEHKVANATILAAAIEIIASLATSLCLSIMTLNSPGKFSMASSGDVQWAGIGVAGIFEKRPPTTEAQYGFKS